MCNDINEELFILVSNMYEDASLEDVRDLLKKGANPLAEFNIGTSLHAAVKYQSPEVVKLLIDYCDFDVNNYDNLADWPLSEPIINMTVSNPNCAVVGMLIDEYGAKCSTEGSENPIAAACSWFRSPFNKNTDIDGVQGFYNFLSNKCHVDDQHIFWNAVQGDYLELCKLVSKKSGVDINAENGEGLSAVHLASGNNSKTTLEWLIKEQGISAELESSSGKKPVHCACSGGINNAGTIMDLYNEYHADFQVPSREGMYPIHYLARQVEDEYFSFFKDCVEEYRLDCNIEDEDGNLPLVYSMYNYKRDITKYLVEQYGADGVQKAYETAFELDEFEYVRFLNEDCGFNLKKEKWVEIVDYEEHSFDTPPMMKVVYKGNPDIYRYCFENHYGAKLPSIKRTHIWEAMENLSYDIVDYLLEKYDAKSYLTLLLSDDYEGIWLAFCEAARLDDISLLKYLVEEKHKTLKDSTHGDSNFRTPLPPLHAAIRNGNLEMVKYLVEICKENPDEFSMEHGSSTLFAVKENKPEIADFLITKYNLSCYSAILSYVEDGRITEALECVSKYKVNVDDLFCAQSIGNDENILPFLKKLYRGYKIDLNYKNEEGKTALINALISGNLEVVKWLVESCKQDLDSIQYEGKNALLLVSQAESVELIKYLVEKYNFDVNVQDSEGNCALIYAVNGRNLAAEENTKIMKFLVEHGADINAADNEGTTILHYMSANGFYDDCDVFDWFIKHGADLSARCGYEEKTPLHVASTCDRLELVQNYILKYGANPNDVDSYGMNAAHYAALNRSTDVVKWLISEGYSDVNCCRQDNNVSLLESAIIGCSDDYYKDDESYLELAKWLISEGADILHFDDNHFSPLHVAANYGNMNAVRYFVEELGVDPGIAETLKNGKKAKKPAQVAAGYDEVKKYLRSQEKEFSEKM